MSTQSIETPPGAKILNLRPPAHERERPSGSERQIRQLLQFADVEIGGSRPWDIHVHKDRVYRRVIADGSLGLGEAYMDGDWDCPALDQFFDRVVGAHLGEKLGFTLPLLVQSLSAKFQNRQDKRRAKTVADVHYDLPIDIFEATFDSRVTGSCGYWKSATTLDDAKRPSWTWCAER